MRRSFVWALALATALGGIIALWKIQADSAPPCGLFCWQNTVMQPDQSGPLWDCMAQQNLTELYLAIPPQADAAQTAAFLQQARENGISVYLLVGDPSWGLDSQGTELCAAVSRVVQWKQALGEDAPVGIMADVEPYLTDAWQEDPQAVMRSYLDGIRLAYNAAESAGVRLDLCIPCYYDTWGLETSLQELVETCHGIAVMNYYRGSEAENLKTEWELANKAGKPLRTVYELQAPGNHDITEQNTYYGVGLDALRANWKYVTRTLSGNHLLGYALHDYAALQKMLAGKEEFS